MKTILSIACLLVSLSSMASEITCKGVETKASIVLGLSGNFFPLNKADYKFNNKIVPTSGYEFGILTYNENTEKKLHYKFQTLKNHKLAKKNSKLQVVIKQLAESSDPFVFTLQAEHSAELKIESEGTLTVIDQLNCAVTSI